MSKPSKNFEYREFVVSKDYPELAEEIELTETDRVKIGLLCRQFLQPVRDMFGTVKILSGKRSQDLNEIIGGSENSDHLFLGDSAAADFFVPTADMKEVWHWLATNRDEVYGQLIFYPNQNFIHISLPTAKHLGEAFTK